MKNIWRWVIFCVIAIFLIWGIAPILFKFQLESSYFSGEEERDTVSKLNTVYVAFGALFTAFAFGGALGSIIYQRKTTLRATSLDIFTRIFNTMQDEPQFKTIFKYIRHRIDKQSDSTDSLKNKEFIWWKDDRKVTTTTYNSIEYFCDKMDYVGILIKQRYIDIVLLYPFGGKIAEAFDILNEISFFEGENKKRWIHFKYLVYLIDKRQNKYEDYYMDIEDRYKCYKKNKTNLNFIQKIKQKRVRRNCNRNCKNFENK